MNLDVANKSLKIETDNFNKIKNIFTRIKEAESLNSKQRIEYFENLFEVKEYENDGLKKIFDSYREGMKKLEAKREEHLNTISSLILPVGDMYPLLIKEQKKNLDDLALRRKEMVKIPPSNSVRSKIEKNHEKSYKDFQKNCLNDSKYILMHYIHSELQYHSTMMEEMNNLFFKINDIEPNAYLEKFGEEYHIKNYNFDRLKIQKIDMKQIKEKEKNRKENQEKEKSEVYSDDDSDEEKIVTKKSSKVKKSSNKKSGVDSGEEDNDNEEEKTVKKKSSRVKNMEDKESNNKINNKSKKSKISSENNEEIKESVITDKKIDED